MGARGRLLSKVDHLRYLGSMNLVRTSSLVALLFLCACGGKQSASPTDAPQGSTATPPSSADTQVSSTDPIASAAPAASSATPVDPPKACTEMGCSSGLTLPLVWGKDTLTSSKYAIELTVDGKKGRCEVVWPYKSCAEVRKATCTGDVPLTLETSCTGEAKSTKDMVIGPLRMESVPAKASLKMWRDKVMWHQQELTLAAKEVRPNGPGCEPVCQQATKNVCIGTCEGADCATKCAP